MNNKFSRRTGSICLLVLSAWGRLVGADAPAALDTVEKSAGDWLKVRAEVARLETEWSNQRQLLDSMVRALAERAQTVEDKRDYLRAKTAKDRADIAALETSNQAGAAELKAADEQMKTTVTALLQLRPSLPPRLSSALEMPFKSLANPELSVSERMQLTMTVLNRCQQFNRSITCEDELLKLGEGDTRQLEVIYWGLSHGYALDRTARQVWFGAPSLGGWRWEALPEGATAVAKLIAIHRGKEEPAFVEVPVKAANKPVASQP